VADDAPRFTSLYADDFPESRRQRGADLYRDGMTRPHPPSTNEIGERTWFVNVFEGRWWSCHVDVDGDGEIFAGCTCMVRDRSPCAHVWAALLAIDDRAWERAVGEHPLWPWRSR
jgi:hypothetical protein